MAERSRRLVCDAAKTPPASDSMRLTSPRTMLSTSRRKPCSASDSRISSRAGATLSRQASATPAGKSSSAGRENSLLSLTMSPRNRPSGPVNDWRRSSTSESGRSGKYGKNAMNLVAASTSALLETALPVNARMDSLSIARTSPLASASSRGKPAESETTSMTVSRKSSNIGSSTRPLRWPLAAATASATWSAGDLDANGPTSTTPRLMASSNSSAPTSATTCSVTLGISSSHIRRRSSIPVSRSLISDSTPSARPIALATSGGSRSNASNPSIAAGSKLSGRTDGTCRATVTIAAS